MEKTIENPVKIQNLMNPTDYAALMGVSLKTVYNWLRDGKIKRVTYMGIKFIDKSTYRG